MEKMRTLYLILLLSIWCACKKKDNGQQVPVSGVQSVVIASVSPSLGDAGIITITGSGFGNDIASVLVRIGDNAATVRSVTPVQVVAEIPNTLSAGLHDVTITVGQRSATRSNSFEFIAWEVSTFAGTGIQGTDNGAGNLASFANPVSIMSDQQGSLYVCDVHRIRRIDQQGVVSNFAGSGIAGLADGSTNVARFRFPIATTVDGMGNIYVSDQGNHCIRKIDLNGIVTTVAGDGTMGYVNGDASTARFNQPCGIAINKDGTELFVADLGNHRVRKVNLWSSTVSDVAGNGTTVSTDGTGGNAGIPSPAGICLLENGDIFVTEKLGNKIRRITPGGETTTWITNLGEGAQPTCITADDEGNLYVVCKGLNRIKRIFNGQATAVDLLGQPLSGNTDGPLSQARFKLPEGVAVADIPGQMRRFYVADNGNFKIRRVQQ